jgi:hypothetical protein
VFAEQVVQLVAAGRRLDQQVLVKQFIEVAAGGVEAGAVECSGSVVVDAGAGNQTESAEQPLRASGQVLIRQGERGRDRHVLGPHERQPIAGRGQVGGQPGGRPGGVMAQLAGDHPDRQRQVSTQADELAHRRIPWAQAGPGRQPGKQCSSLAGGQDVEADHRGVLQRGQPTAASHQHQAARSARQQRLDLLMPDRIIQQQQDLLARHGIAPPGRAGLQI